MVASGMGARQTCALVAGGAIACWGSWGMKKDVAGAKRLDPVPLMLEGAEDIEELVVTGDEIFGRRGAQVLCWKRDWDGKPIYAAPVPEFEGETITRIFGGEFMLYGLRSDDRLLIRNGGAKPGQHGLFTIDAELTSPPDP